MLYSIKYMTSLWICLQFLIQQTVGIENKFSLRALSQQEDGLVFKKIEGRKGKLQWAALCSKHDACKSFYLDDGACVFGLSDDVTEFANGDDVTPADGQMLMTKRKSFTSNYIVKRQTLSR